MWNQLSYFLNTKNSKSKRNSVNKLIIDGKTVSNDKEIANALNSHFLNVGPNSANKVNHSSVSHKDYLLNPTTDTVFLTPTDSIEISEEISSLKNKKSGIDVFKTSLIKSVKDEIMEALVIIFKKSFSEGQLPYMLKIAKVIPVFKGGEASDPNNYRPISLLMYQSIPNLTIPPPANLRASFLMGEFPTLRAKKSQSPHPPGL